MNLIEKKKKRILFNYQSEKDEEELDDVGQSDAVHSAEKRVNDGDGSA